MSLLSRITSPIKKAFQERERYLIYKEYRDHFKLYMLNHNLNPEERIEGEDEYYKVWRQLCTRIEPYSYRFFSHYMGKIPYIVPEDIGRTFIEYYLNPLPYRAFYSDKNMYQQYLSPSSAFPKAYFRRIDGSCLLDDAFVIPCFDGISLSFESSALEIANYIPDSRIVLKKSTDSGGGYSILCFCKNEKGIFSNSEIGELSGNYLRAFSSNFVIQEVIQQHPFFSQFCSSSLNTMRLYVYRSVKDESINIYSALLRIGNEGSFVDNLTQGGMSVPIDVETGKLGRVGVVGHLGFLKPTHNGIDFSKGVFAIPKWNELKEFACSIARQNRHCHMIALDLALDVNNQIRMIEYNVGDNSYWWSMYFGIQPFGTKIQEVIDYCIEQKKHDPRFR